MPETVNTPQDNEEVVTLPSDEQQADTTTPTATQEAQESKPEESNKSIEPEVVSKIDVSVYEKEFAEKGALSEESYKALENVGIPKEIVDRYIEGRTAYTQSYDDQIMSVAGNKQGYEQLIKWAADNLPEAEILSYNKAVTSGDIELAKLATTGLLGKYNAVQGSSNARTIEGSTGSSSAGAYYNSIAELVADQKDNRYKTDKRYRQAVEAKVQRSIQAGKL